MSAKSIRPYQVPKAVIERVRRERLRQMELLKRGKIEFTLATAGIDPNRKVRVLCEEMGEVARAIEHIEILRPLAKTNDEAFEGVVEAQANLRDELTQLAACSVAWLELLEGSGQ